MSYQVLARKWRPQKFAELVGQQHVVTALSNALANDRLHHAYLFTGTRGVGKTTIARIFAKSLNCIQGVTTDPCGQCQNCCSIDEGRFVDLVEVDAASRTKVEDTREILDNVQYSPTQGRYKVYLIDEVHMLSRHSFNALLKTLEEPPPHVKFLLATTDPQKLPITILSRCLQFSLKSMSIDQIEYQLGHILKSEHINFEDNALTQLANAANGSMRDALSLTDQAIAQGNAHVTATIVRDMLGMLDEQHISTLLKAMFSGDFNLVMQALEDLKQAAIEPEQALLELINAVHQMALIQVLPTYSKLNPKLSLLLTELATQTPAEQLQLYYQVLIAGRKDLPFAANPTAGLEMTLLRLIAFSPVSNVEQTHIVEPEVKAISNDINTSTVPNIQALASQQPASESTIQPEPLPVDNTVKKTAEFDNEVVTERHHVENINAVVSNTHELNSQHHHAQPLDNEAVLNDSVKAVSNEVNEAELQVQPATESDAALDYEVHNQLSNVMAAQFSAEPIAEDNLFSQQAQIESSALSQGYQPESNTSPVAEPPSVLADVAPQLENTYPVPPLDEHYIQTATDEFNHQIEQPTFNSQQDMQAQSEPPQFAQSTSFEAPPVHQNMQDVLGILTEVQNQKNKLSETDEIISPQELVNHNEPNNASVLGHLQQNSNEANSSSVDIHTPELESKPTAVEQTTYTATQSVQPAVQPLPGDTLEDDSPPWVDTLSGDMFEEPDDENHVPNQVAPKANESVEVNTYVDQNTQLQQPVNLQPQANLHPDNLHPDNLAIEDKVRQGIVKSAQIDSWSQLIDNASIVGLKRQFALHSTIKKQGDLLTLTLERAHEHLNTESNRLTLTEELSVALGQSIRVQVVIDEGQAVTPFNIQQSIDSERLNYAKEIIRQDENVNALKNAFNATVDEDTIKAR